MSIELDDTTTTILAGLTNRNGKAFVKLLEASCVLSALDRLQNLLPIAERERERWRLLSRERRWIADSDVSRFMSRCPANPVDSDLRLFMESDFAKSGQFYLSQDQNQLLRYLMGGDVQLEYGPRNERFLSDEIKRFSQYFDTVEKNPLTNEQREAVVTFADNVMTVAAAGSGKTSVLIAKAGYAISADLFKPEQIVLLAFNRKAAEELAERVAERLGPRIEGAERIRVATFHSLGLDIIAEATGKRPMVAPWIEQGLEIAELVDIVKTLSNDKKFASKWNLFQTVLARPLPPFGTEEEPEWWDRENDNRGFRTLRGETVKSQEERMICNWLAWEGVDYEYERPYEHGTATATHRQYLPDFYYPSANVYHEHFALDHNGVPPRHFTGYAEGVTWKRELHSEHETNLVETTSFGIRSYGGFEKFKADLTAAAVKFSEIELTGDELALCSDDASLLRVFRTFMSHVKSNQLTMSDLRTRAASRRTDNPERDRVFLDIFESLWREWDRRLADAGALDFEGMLGEAVNHLASGRCTMPYRLVMADEFQDTSRVRGAMLKHLTSDEKARLYVVGDDWQAVNRFAGADISLMRNFEQHIGPCTTTELTWTFRCPADICDIAGTFVAQNPYQIKKLVRSTNERPAPNVVCFQFEDIDAQYAALRSHLRQLARKVRKSDENSRVAAYVLGRYNNDQPIDFSSMAAEISDAVDLRWSTIHSSKGLEADYVFLVNVVEGTYGMPSEIADDSTLWIAMPDGEDFPHAEERRLFYVALTRAKRMVSIYTDAHCRSEFIAELERQENGMQVRMEGGTGEKRRSCQKCELGVLVLRVGKYGEFLSCSRFPRCEYSENSKKPRARH